MKYKIEITETLQKVVEIEANSIEDAYRTISQMYKEEKIILDSNDYIDTDITYVNE